VGTGACMPRKVGGSSAAHGVRGSSRPTLWSKRREGPGPAAVAGGDMMRTRRAVEEGADEWDPGAGGCGPPWAAAVGSTQNLNRSIGGLPKSKIFK
jgi:hypothetical protein